MARAKKDGKFLNCYIRKEIFDRLTEYCNSTAIPKTAVVEKALIKYLYDAIDNKVDEKNA